MPAHSAAEDARERAYAAAIRIFCGLNEDVDGRPRERISRIVRYAAREPPAGRQSRLARSNNGLMSGQNNRMSASVVIEPTSPFDQNTRRSPPAPIIAKRKASSARLPSTNASVNGANGIPIFLNT